MIRNGNEIVGKIEELLFIKRTSKNKTELGIALGARENDIKQNQWRKFDLFKKQLENGKIDQEKLQKVAEYLETTIEELMIKEDNNSVITQNSSGNKAVFENSANNVVEFRRSVSRDETLSLDDKINILFDDLMERRMKNI